MRKELLVALKCAISTDCLWHSLQCSPSKSPFFCELIQLIPFLVSKNLHPPKKNGILLAWAIPPDCLRPSLLPPPSPPSPLFPQWSQASKSLTTSHYSSHYLSLLLSLFIPVVAFAFNSILHGLSARRVRRMKSSRPKAGPKGHKLEVDPPRGPRLLVTNNLSFTKFFSYFYS